MPKNLQSLIKIEIKKGFKEKDVFTMEIALERIRNCVNGILNLYYLKLTELPPLPEGIVELNCSNNQLTSLPPLPSTLKKLICSSNQLTSLPELPSLHLLYCYANQLTSLPPLPSSLRDLYCSTNRLTSLPLLPSTIQYIKCCRNPLTTLPNLPLELRELLCTYCTLASLPPLPARLCRLLCLGNSLETLPELPSTLQELRCDLPMFDDTIAMIQLESWTVKLTNDMIRKATVVWEGLSRERCNKRCAQYKEEIMMKAWHPSRVEKLLHMGYDVEDM
jgi:hypothetical protein